MTTTHTRGVLQRQLNDTPEKRYQREVLAARTGHDKTPAAPRPRPPAAPTAHKQTGRRYGPPPKHDPHQRMQAPAPMTFERRKAAYEATRPTATFFTQRQSKQLRRMDELSGEITRCTCGERQCGKGRPTPKRKR